MHNWLKSITWFRFIFHLRNKTCLQSLVKPRQTFGRIQKQISENPRVFTCSRILTDFAEIFNKLWRYGQVRAVPQMSCGRHACSVHSTEQWRSSSLQGSRAINRCFACSRQIIQISSFGHLGHRSRLAGLKSHKEFFRSHGGIQQDFPLYSDHFSHLRCGQSWYFLEKSAPDLATNTTFCTDIKSSVSRVDVQLRCHFLKRWYFVYANVRLDIFV